MHSHAPVLRAGQVPNQIDSLVFQISGKCSRNHDKNYDFNAKHFISNHIPCSGVACSVNIDDCNLSPCQNGGTCDDLLGGYQCNCIDGFTGTKGFQRAKTGQKLNTIFKKQGRIQDSL